MGVYLSCRSPLLLLRPTHFIPAYLFIPACLFVTEVSPLLRDCDGVVTLWDTARGQSVSEHEGHERRVWSVDFLSCPSGDATTFVSGSDDCTVKVRGKV